MGSKSKARKAEINNKNVNLNLNLNVIGKGKVTPVQVAFIVDRYLADNNFTQTRSTFRSEASSLIAKSSLVQVPKSLMSLGELLDEYIWLKEQKVIIEQQKCVLAHEKCRIQTLLQGMQGVMNAYNSATAVNCLTPPPPPPSVLTSTSLPITCSTGYSASKTPVLTSVTTIQSAKVGRTDSITPITGGRPPRKRRSSYKDLEDAPQAPKKSYSGPLANYPFQGKVSNAVGEPSNTCSREQRTEIDSTSPNFAQGGLPIQGSSVAKNLFDQPSQSPTSNSSVPKTPPRAVSSPSDKSISPQEDVSSTAMSHHTTNLLESTPTKCTIISSKTIIVSPDKHYSIERNECTFSSPAKRQSKRDHVKGRLDFDSSDVPSSLENVSGDGTSTSESEKEGDTFDLELPNFDAFGPDFSLTELLTDFGIDCENLNYSCPATACTSTDAILQSVHERNNRELGNSQDLIEHSSAVTDVAANKTVNGSDTVTSVKSVRKCIEIVSPSKRSRNDPALGPEDPCDSNI
ncbi:hypothetical protein RND81_08G037000 [Saponaria officinalis]|uniref:LisH domain-containing protein n=1 Tax=Saponaria officinalis TaxID=3572 RepID=A0AAW1J4B7_SAPOF